jgi:hypothetical protein
VERASLLRCLARVISLTKTDRHGKLVNKEIRSETLLERNDDENVEIIM